MAEISSRVTFGEAQTMLAPVLGIERDSIRAYLVIAVADCPGHGHHEPHHAIRIASSEDEYDVVRLIRMAVVTLATGEYEEL